MSKKLFSERQVDLSAFLGGPIPAGILIFKNHFRLGDKRIAFQSLIATIIFTVLFFYLLLKIPDEVIEKVPNYVFSAFYAILVIIYFKIFLAKDVKKAFDEGTEKASNWTVAGFTILGVILNILIIFLLAMNEPYYEGDLVKFHDNELYYNSPGVNKEQVETLMKELIEFGFFAEDYSNVARIQNINEQIHVTLVVDKSLWSDQEIISSLQHFRNMLNFRLNKNIKLKIESVSLSGKTEFKYIF